MNYLRVLYSTIHNTTILFQKTQQIFSLIKVLEEYNKASHWLIQIIITISWYRDLCSNWPWSPRQVDNYWGHWIRCVECSRLYSIIVVFTKFQNMFSPRFIFRGAWHSWLQQYYLGFKHFQGRQSVPKSGRSERGEARNFRIYQTIAPKNLLFKGYFCSE